MTDQDTQTAELVDLARTGVRLAGHDPITDRAAWLAQRQTGIGSSDLPVLLDLSRFKTPLDLWADKRGLVEDEPAGVAAEWGNRLEDAVARWWLDHYGRPAGPTRTELVPVPTACHVARPWQMVSIDRLIECCPDGHEHCALEVKTRSAYVAGHWADGVPDDVAAQCLWQIDALGLDAVHVVVLIGGNDPRVFTVLPNPDVQRDLRALGEAFHRRVLDNDPPPATLDDRTLSLFRRMFGDPAGELAQKATPDELDTIHDLLDEYEAAHKAGKAQEAAKTAAKVALVALLDHAAGATDLVDPAGVPLFTWRTKTTRRVDLDAMRTDAPDFVGKYTTTKTDRTFNVTRKGTTRHDQP